MAKMRIYEIARSMQQQNKKIKSSDLVSYLNANGYEVKSAQSSIEGDAIPFLMVSYQKGLRISSMMRATRPVRPKGVTM